MPACVEVPETFKTPATDKLPVSLMKAVLIPANVEVAEFWVNDALIVVEPVFETEKKVDVAPVFTISKRSASCPLADLTTSGMELTAVPLVEVASKVRTAFEKGDDVPMVNWFRVLSEVKRERDEIELAVL